MNSSRKAKIGLAFLVLSTLSAISCRKNVPAAPPPPPPPLSTTPAPAPPAPLVTLRANGEATATIDRGQALTLTWESRNAATVRIEPGLGQVDLNGNRQVNPAASVTYTATAVGPGGTTTDVARITVNVPPAAPPAKAAGSNPPRPTVGVDELFRQNVEDIYFDYDKAELRSNEMSKLQSGARWLQQNPTVRFTIEGHCDERGSEQYNLALGDRRANAVREYLVSQGVQGSRIVTVSYGEERPQCREQNEACFDRNRRAHFALN
ncbi:MAG: peptidoglycan-associated lipoprotein Pal [Acidobacteria bacterium]|nr:peptidoglycan-associated lipoprotein Pal [Acidobacteriota bacterium]